MSYRALALYPFCTFRTLSRHLLNPITQPQWQQTRTMMRMQKRKPARMDLSGRVARPRDAFDKAAERGSRAGREANRKPAFAGVQSRRGREPDQRSSLSGGRSRDSGGDRERRGRQSRPPASGVSRDGPVRRTSRPTDSGRPAFAAGPSSPRSAGRSRAGNAFGAPSRRDRDDRSGRREDFAKRRSGDPFGGLNRTEAPAGLKRSRTSRTKPDEDQSRPQTRPRDSSDGPRRRSTEPFHALKMQQALGSIAYGRRGDIKEKIAELDSFAHFPLLPVIQEAIQPQALPGMTDVAPTPVQRVAIPVLLAPPPETDKRRKSRAEAFEDKPTVQEYLMAAETGSGKTLAYLLPVIDAMKRAEITEREQEAKEAAAKEEQKRNWQANSLFELEPPPLATAENNTARPKAIILVPSAELVTQIGAVAKALSHTIKFKTAMLSTSFTPTVIRNRLFSPSGVDLVISTPHLLASIVESSPNILARVTHLVVDEADSMFDRSFSPLTTSIIDRAAPSLKQIILCSATITRSLDNYITKRFPDMTRLVTPNLHAIPRRVQLGVVNVNNDPYRGKKDLACADTIWGIGRSALEHDDPTTSTKTDMKRIIVFVNERETAVELATFLQERGIDAEALNRDTPARQSEILLPFKAGSRDAASVPRDAPVTADRGPNYVPPNSKVKRTLSNTKVIVATDLGSRGIDTLACRHVILYDVPHTSIDFIHRLGRLGRMGRRGRAVVLLGKGDRADVVKEVRDAMYAGKALI